MYGVAYAQEDVADILSEEIKIAGDKQKKYFLHISKNETTAPKSSYRLLVVLPGGDGGEEFQTFVKRILKFGLPPGYLVAQAIAPKWTKAQKIVWPTRKICVEKQQFSTEEFIEAIVTDVRKRKKVDDRSIFCMGWSSSGPAVYAIALQERTQCIGFFVTMSVFKPENLPFLGNARQRIFYIEHSPDDQICPYWMAENARDDLQKSGAQVKFKSYKGGHGWVGNVYKRITAGVKWLQSGGKGIK